MKYRTWLYSKFEPEVQNYFDAFWEAEWPKDSKLRPIDHIRGTMGLALRDDYFADKSIEHDETRDDISYQVNYLEVFIGLIESFNLRFNKESRDKDRNLALMYLIKEFIKKAEPGSMIFQVMLIDFAKGRFRAFLKMKYNVKNLSINDQFFLYLHTKEILKVSKSEIQSLLGGE